MKSNLISKTRRSLALLCGAGFLVAVAAATIQPAMAQNATTEAPSPQKPPHEKKGPNWQKLQPVLGLTDEQVSELENIMADQKAKADAVRQNASLTPEQKREQMRSIREEGKEESKTILTEEQRQKMEQMRDRRMEGRGKGDKCDCKGKDKSKGKVKAQPAPAN